MQYERLPHTNLEISTVGMGCYAAAGVYGEFDEEAFVDLLRLGYDEGVTLYDTAPTYGEGEKVLGRAVRPFRGEVVLATKVGLTPDGGRDCSFEHIKCSAEQSLRRLDTGYIDLLQVHFDDPATPVADTVGALDTLKREGKILEYGIGHLPPGRVKEYLAVGSPASSLMELNCVSREQYRHVFPLLDGSAGVIGFSPSARGLLAGRVGIDTCLFGDDPRRFDPLYRGEKFRSVLRVVEELRDLAAEIGASPVQAALRWALHLPGVSAVLTGTSSPLHLRENLAAADIAWSEQLQERVNQVLDREEERFAQELPGEIRSILRNAPSCLQEGLWDLVYVMEHAVSCGWVEEGDILPLFGRLWAMREAGVDEGELASIRSALDGLLLEDFS